MQTLARASWRRVVLQSSELKCITLDSFPCDAAYHLNLENLV
jgi:hypothetical protein